MMTQPSDARLNVKAGPVVVAGGLNTDILSRLSGPLDLGTSNLAQTTFSAGGVGRNVAQNLAQLGVPTKLLGVVGHDAFGANLLSLTGQSGVDVSGVLRRNGATGSYTAVLTEGGELHAGLSSMALTQNLTPADAAPWTAQLEDASVLIIDANLPFAVVEFLLCEAASRGIKVVLEPVSAPKAAVLRPLLAKYPIWLITPDLAELTALSGVKLTAQPEDGALLHLSQTLQQSLVQHVLVTLGKRGSLLVGEGPPIHTLARQAQVREVTGAGDALLAGLIAALWRQQTWHQALAEAHLSAALTIETVGAVRPDLSAELLHQHRARLPLRTETLP